MTVDDYSTSELERENSAFTKWQGNTIKYTFCSIMSMYYRTYVK